ncbi:hypothetical protein BJX65DRAFT_305260 [Aspergillus insuetus]
MAATIKAEDTLRIAVRKRAHRSGYTEEGIQTVLAQQDALRRREGEDGNSDGQDDEKKGGSELKRDSWTKVARRYVQPGTLHAYDVPWQSDDVPHNSFLVVPLLDEFFEHTRRARESSTVNAYANALIRSTNPSAGNRQYASAYAPASSNVRKTYASPYETRGAHDEYVYPTAVIVDAKNDSRNTATSRRRQEWLYTA